ncbi:hypothetical protein QEH56_13565 [Pelagicoccus enzymogenes]|uniref:hypothetical protein n=1 Tax=Pelagicoccus enzymogenes TaxID=2773457 RepID=UPI00280FF99C|nr:hypothetical protein [Pelagicoccus enzymogenes]MDQ8199191.1 hypothetical protein [Pelagicoccus enzymogenes]
MQHDDKLLQANLPDALQSAIEEIDGAFDVPKQLLRADVSSFESLECCVFAYFARDDVFYLNQKGRELLRRKQPRFEPQTQSPPPLFWLEDDSNLQAADDFVASRQRPIFETRELVTLSWGKTWLHGSKFPIRSVLGQPLAILFAGHEVPPSQQIKLVAEHYQNAQHGTGNN